MAALSMDAPNFISIEQLFFDLVHSLMENIDTPQTGTSLQSGAHLVSAFDSHNFLL